MIIVYYLLITYGLFAVNKFRPIKVVTSFDWWSRVNGFDVGGFSFFPFIFISIDLNNTWHAKLVRHETVHIKQSAILTPVLFYILYVGSYLYYRLRGKKHYDAYMSIPFEIQAYKKQG